MSKPVRQETLLHVAKLAFQHQELVQQKGRFQSHLEAIFRSVKDGILTVDQDMNLMEMNDAAKTILGISGEAIGQFIGQRARSCLEKFRPKMRFRWNSIRRWPKFWPSSISSTSASQRPETGEAKGQEARTSR